MTVFRVHRLVALIRYSARLLKSATDLYEVGSICFEITTAFWGWFNDLL